MNRFCDDHPEMESRFEEIMDLMESSGDEIGSMDEAEDRIDVQGSECTDAQRLVSASGAVGIAVTEFGPGTSQCG